MEVTIDIRYEQLLAAKIKQLKSVLDEGFIYEKASEDLSDFQSYLLKGPVMNAEQFEQHRADRKHWRYSSFV